MNAEIRRLLFDALEDLAQRYPHWRLGQLVCNVAGWTDTDVWDVEDEQLLEALRQQHGYEGIRPNADSSTLRRYSAADGETASRLNPSPPSTG